MVVPERKEMAQLRKLTDQLSTVLNADDTFYDAFTKIVKLTKLTSYCENQDRCSKCVVFDNGCLLTEIRNVAEEQLARW